MGGSGAPDDLQKGYETPVWLAVNNEDNAKVSGQYFYHQAIKPYNLGANNIALQRKFFALWEAYTGVRFPA